MIENSADYELFVAHAVDHYKASLPRHALLRIGDEAVTRLAQFGASLTEAVLCDEVDRLVALRLRLPSYAEWRRDYNVFEERSSALVDASGHPVASGAAAEPILVAASEISNDLVRKLGRRPEAIFALSPRKFELLIAELLSRDGFDVTVTPATRDGGKDIIARMRTTAGSFVVFVECKRYAATRPVGVSIARELIGVVHAERATSGLLVTTSSFSAEVHRLQNSMPHRLDLKAYQELAAWLRETQHRPH